MDRKLNRNFNYFSVDSLLQIHALYNLILMKSEMNLADDVITEYGNDLETLEWKYIQTNADIVHGIQLKQKEFETETHTLQDQFETTQFVWWSDLLCTGPEQDEQKLEQLIRKIIFELKDQYKLEDVEWVLIFDFVI